MPGSDKVVLSLVNTGLTSSRILALVFFKEDAASLQGRYGEGALVLRFDVLPERAFVVTLEAIGNDVWKEVVVRSRDVSLALDLVGLLVFKLARRLGFVVQPVPTFRVKDRYLPKNTVIIVSVNVLERQCLVRSDCNMLNFPK